MATTLLALPRRERAVCEIAMQAPSHIDGARVLRVADLRGTRATGITRLYADGELQVSFKRLALAQYEGGETVYIFYCDAEWACLNDMDHSSVAAAEARAAEESRASASRTPDLRFA